MIGTENFWWSEENYCDSRHLRGNIDGFLPDGKSGNINRNTNWSRCDICVQNVESAGSAGPRGPATWTDSDDFFFLERASPTPTWIRPLFEWRGARASFAPDFDRPHALNAPKAIKYCFKYIFEMKPLLHISIEFSLLAPSAKSHARWTRGLRHLTEKCAGWAAMDFRKVILLFKFA
jgi:hypothetical protein